MQQTQAAVFAELGTVQGRPCVMLAQPTKDNLVALVLAVVGGNLKRLDLCVVPTPHVRRYGAGSIRRRDGSILQPVAVME